MNMIKQMQKAACALAVLSATALPAMAESVDVRVIGTIAPTACTPTLSGGGTIDYGSINPDTLSATDFTVLDEKQLTMTITCDAPAKIAVQSYNKRPNTLAGATELTGDNSAPAPAGVLLFNTVSIPVVGLGLDGDAKIGGYGIRVVTDTALADTVAVTNIQTSDKTFASWGNKALNAGSLYYAKTVPIFTSWAPTGTTSPVAFKTLTATLGIQAYINKTSELDLTKPVRLDGLTTIELIYL